MPSPWNRISMHLHLHLHGQGEREAQQPVHASGFPLAWEGGRRGSTPMQKTCIMGKTNLEMFPGPEPEFGPWALPQGCPVPCDQTGSPEALAQDPSLRPGPM